MIPVCANHLRNSPTQSEQSQGEPLDLKHQALLDIRLQALGEGRSEYCFSNLYLFRHVHRYQVLQKEHLFISGVTYDGCSFLMPVFELKEEDSLELASYLEGYDCFYPIGEADLPHFDPEYFKVTYNPDDSDYIFDARKLQTYSGRSLAAKKNLLHQFLNRYQATVAPLDHTVTADACLILGQWLTDSNKAAAATDFASCLEALNKQEVLGLFGFVVYADNKPAGFILCKEVIPGICVIHFAKGNRHVKGIYQFMFHQLANTFADRFRFYNFEQDLGIPNFRKTKRSYDPDRLLKKFRISSKNGKAICRF